MAELRGMRCDPGGAGSEVDEGSEIEVDTGNEGKSNNEEWRIVNRKKMKRKQRESEGEKGEEEQSSEIKVILRFQSPCTSNPLKVKAAVPEVADGPLHSIRPGDFVVIKDFRRKHWKQKRWQGPYQVLLVTHTAVKVAEKVPWIHGTHCRKVPAPAVAATVPAHAVAATEGGSHSQLTSTKQVPD
ncbi:uncharacterized protein LOC143757172 [Siphateles boraxobius]|uniref:uncharacterized protein LOC143757172 n=1 Tax=Siphateles boraxobius TaxID=180520 RepID=UPI0040644EE3